MPQLAQQPVAVGDDVVLVDRLEVLLARRDERVVAQLGQVVEDYTEMPEGAFVLARQENLETIHRHNVVAERAGELSEVIRELDSGEHSPRHVTMREWLEAPAR